jgi:hypothetical protein
MGQIARGKKTRGIGGNMKEEIKNNCLTCQKRKHCVNGNGMAITWTHCGNWKPDIAQKNATKRLDI